MVALCDRLLDDIDEIVDTTAGLIRSTYPDYALVPLEEHRATVHEQLSRRLAAFRDERAWDPQDLEQAVILARRRARQGVPIDTLICAYHLGDREIWRRISAQPADTPALFAQLASLLLESMQTISSTLVSAHSSESRAQQSSRATVSQRLLDLLSAGRTDIESERLAQFLGFDPARSFTALAWHPSDPHAAAAELQRLADHSAFSSTHAQFRNDCLILVQGADPVALRTAARDLSMTGSVGAGCEEVGISGAALSIQQSRLALTSVTKSNPLSLFAEDWLRSCATSQAGLLRSVTARSVAIAVSNPQLADTILRFADTSMSVAACARVSHLHVNTVTYRLDRWTKLTGWNPRDFHDLSSSVIACILAENMQAPDEDNAR